MDVSLESPIDLQARLLSSLLEFTKFFYKLRTGREFIVSQPIGRESHHIAICRFFMDIFQGKIKKGVICIPPRYAKTELAIHFAAFGLANYPDSNNIYTSYAHSLAAKQTKTIREIISHPLYKRLFGTELKKDSFAKDDFETIQGGSVYGAGTGGTITGRGAGIQNREEFGGIIIMDDLIKPDEAMSDTIREGAKDWVYNTLQSRRNSSETPMVYIGQQVHEDDVANMLLNKGWSPLILPALDAAGNALNPAMHTKEELLKMKEEMPYVFAAQYQQNPIPSGGGAFKKDWFYLMDEWPEIITTFITCDSAESSKNYADYTVFSFWGLYKIQESGYLSDDYALHWIDCRQERIEPKDLHAEFMAFYADCMQFKVKPKLAAIEKKSTGATLFSVLNEARGLNVIAIERSKSNPMLVGLSKADRFLTMQPYIAKKLISLPRYGKHTNLCIDHMSKITLNMSHRHDDICDTVFDAILISLIEKKLDFYINKQDDGKLIQSIISSSNRLDKLRAKAYRH